MQILVTGGAGYIGSHTLVELLEAGYQPLVLDNLCNSSQEALTRVEAITGKKLEFIKGDIRDEALLTQIFSQNAIQAVIHFAGLKAVGESVADPLAYYSNNVHGSQVLFSAMQAAGVYQLVFSSSATVYGEPEEIPITENCPLKRPTNPYGYSKQIIEEMLCDLAVANSNWRIALLRYFNPIGAHDSGQLGEDPQGIPNNLVPYIAKVAIGELPFLQVFGNNYPTPDGTGVRDYLHVVDLALGHLAALNYLENNNGVHTFNLGTGKGYSVLEILQAFEQACGKELAYKILPPRPGDLATCYANPTKAKQQLNWQAKRDLQNMLETTWQWQKKNPRGYTS